MILPLFLPGVKEGNFYITLWINGRYPVALAPVAVKARQRKIFNAIRAAL